MSYPDNFSSRGFNRYWNAQPAPGMTRRDRIILHYGHLTAAEVAALPPRFDAEARQILADNLRRKSALVGDVTQAERRWIAPAAAE